VPNSQLFPQSIYPLSGDVITTPGSPHVTVQGLQGEAISPAAPAEGNALLFTGTQWAPSAVSLSDNSSILVNGVVVSDDYEIFCNNVDVSGNQVNSAFPPNGPPILCNGVPVG
jgi:hypothetical protein